MTLAIERPFERLTAAEIDRARRAEIDQSVRYHAARPHEIPARLTELEREWSLERALQANAASFSLAGLALAAFVDRRFLLLPAAVAGFLLQHAVQGWCPPVPVLRRIGFRTAAEICQERCGLAMLLGEYRPSGAAATARWVERPAEIHEAVDA